MRIFKRLKKIRFMIVFLIINAMLSFLLEPARGASEIMWGGYYAEEELDTIFIGSSLCQGTFDPVMFNEQLGIKSYNMGTPSQALPQTIRALEVALAEHDIETVIFGMGFSSLKLDVLDEAELTFEKARAKKRGGIKGIADALSYLYSEDVRDEENSINFFFPWLYNREEISVEMITENIKLKFRRMKEELFGGGADALQSFTKGYQSPGVTVFNYDNMWELNTYRYYDAEFEEDILQEFEELLEICNKNEVDLIVVNTPHPYFDVIACYEFYESNQKEIEALCREHGVDYYDFNLAKPEIFETRPEYYRDYEHLNYEGSQAFCKSMCEFMIRRENGENLDEAFYSVDEFLEIHSEWLEDWKTYYW